jgi:hypothetical protein
MAAGEFIKIGVTTDLRQRQSDLQCACPFLVELRRVYLPPSDIHIIKIEQIAHRALAEFHVRGEWFRAEGLRLFDA